MTQIPANSAIEMQARSAVQGDRTLRAASRLRSSEMRDRSGRVVADPQKRDELLRQRVDELVGLTFYGTLLKTMRNSPLKGPYGHGGRGEEVFRGQLDLLLAQQAGRASRFSLNEAIYRRLSKASGRAVATTGSKET